MYIKKFIDFLKKIFFKQNKELIIKKTDTIESIDKETIKNININWNLINKLNNYDIIFVKMTDEEIKQRNIEISHQKRPFLIIKKDDKSKTAYGYYFSSNMQNTFFNQYKNKGLKLVINKNDYHLNKNTMLLFQNEIKLPYENIIHPISHLTTDDLTKLRKYKKLLLQEPILSDKENKIIETGDIIIANDSTKYIIYQIDNTNCYGYPIYQTDKKYIDLKENPEYILFYKTIYFIDYKNQKIFNNNDTLCIIARFNDETIERINQNKKEIKHLNKTKKKTIKNK